MKHLKFLFPVLLCTLLLGLSVLLTYDKENDRILLSPGGEYKRSKQPIKK